MSASIHVGSYLRSRWKVWAPPLLLTIVVFVGLLLFVQGGEISVFTYKIF